MMQEVSHEPNCCRKYNFDLMRQQKEKENDNKSAYIIIIIINT